MSHKFISVAVIELSARCLNTGPEDRLEEEINLHIFWKFEVVINDKK